MMQTLYGTWNPEKREPTAAPWPPALKPCLRLRAGRGVAAVWRRIPFGMVKRMLTPAIGQRAARGTRALSASFHANSAKSTDFRNPVLALSPHGRAAGAPPQERQTGSGMGLIRLALGAGIVAAVVMAGEADTRQEALTSARTTASAAVEFCREQPQVCAAAATAGAAAALGSRAATGTTGTPKSTTPAPAKDRKRAASLARQGPPAGN